MRRGAQPARRQVAPLRGPAACAAALAAEPGRAVAAFVAVSEREPALRELGAAPLQVSGPP